MKKTYWFKAILAMLMKLKPCIISLKKNFIKYDYTSIVVCIPGSWENSEVFLVKVMVVYYTMYSFFDVIDLFHHTDVSEHYSHISTQCVNITSRFSYLSLLSNIFLLIHRQILSSCVHIAVWHITRLSFGLGTYLYPRKLKHNMRLPYKAYTQP